MKGRIEMKVLISEQEYENLLKYKALYENEKSHTETLKAILDKILPAGTQVEIRGNVESCTEQQKRDISNAVQNIANVISEYFESKYE